MHIQNTTPSNEVIEKIKEQVLNNPVVLYMKGSPQIPQCGFSARTSQALLDTGEKFAFVNVLSDSEIRSNLPLYSDWPTFPQLFVSGELIGGCDIVMELAENDELAPLLKEAS